MEKINKKGFTLVEVLGVIVIIGIIALLITAAIMGYFQSGKDEYNKKLSDQLVLSGKTYYSEHKEELPTEISDNRYAFVTVPEMQNGNYITNSFIDSENRECSPSYVYVSENYETKQYEYTPCLICQDSNGTKNYSEGSKYCDPSLWEKNSFVEEEDTDDVCDKEDLGYITNYDGTCKCPAPKVETDGRCDYEVTPPQLCEKEDLGYITDTDGSCKCPAPKVEKNGECVYDTPNTCPKINKGYTNGPNGECLCKAPKVELDGECIIPESKFTCKGTYDTATKKTTISTATSKYAIYRMYYTVGTSTTENSMSLTAAEKSSGKIANKTYTSIPENANIYIEDMYGGTSGVCSINEKECPKLDKGYENAANGTCKCPSPKVEKKIDGVMHCTNANSPACEFTSIPSGYIGTSGATFKIKCTNSDTTIKVLDKSKITTVNGNGTLSNVTYTTSSTEKTITFTGKYTPKSGKEAKDKIKAAAGLVGNKNDTSKKNAAITSGYIYIDTKDPTITYKVTKGTSQKATAKGDSGSGYKNSVSVQVKCTDGGSGVKTLKVGGSTVSGSSKTVTKSGRGTYTISASCTDKSGNSTSASKKYRVLESTRNCSKCGVAEYKACIKYCKYAKSCCTGGYYTSYSCPRGGSLSGTRCNGRKGPYGSQAVCQGVCVTSGGGRCWFRGTAAEPGRPKIWWCEYSYAASKSSRCRRTGTSYSICGCKTWAWKSSSSCGCKTGKSCWY